MIGRGLAGWGLAWERDAAKGHPPKPDIRLVHPLIAAAIWIAALPIIYTMVAARHETLEILGTPRDAETHVVRGAESVTLPATAPVRGAVLLIHGFLGSPADFGDLPQVLAAKGYVVSAPRLPGHGRLPSDVVGIGAKEYDDVVESARAELAQTHGKVSVVGMSFGGALAIRNAAAHTPHRLVLVNPYLGATATPSWLPVSSDALLDLTSHLFRRVFRPAGITRVNDPEGLARQRAYYSVSVPASVTARTIARESAPLIATVSAPTTLLISVGDHTVASATTAEWFAGAVPQGVVQRFERSDHVLLLDYDRAAATESILRALE